MRKLSTEHALRIERLRTLHGQPTVPQGIDVLWAGPMPACLHSPILLNACPCPCATCGLDTTP